MEPNDEKLRPPGKEPKLLEPPHDSHERAPFRRIFWPAVIVLLALGAMLAFGFWRHHRTQSVAEASAEREQQALPRVNVAPVRRARSTTELVLPGNITPVTEAFLYARASGYVRRRYADIGDRVKQGELLAEIEAPDLDQQVQQGRAALAGSEQQLRQARADLEDARSQMELARVTWDRYQILVSHGAISRQDADTQFAAYRSARANVNSGEANVSNAEQNVQGNRANLDRLIALQSFERVRAPFDGVITSRTFDIGALISGTGSSSGSSGGSSSGGSGSTGSSSLVGGGGGELFRVAQIGTLRILINVPQEASTAIRAGQPAAVTVAQFAAPFDGRVTRTASAVDPNTRTLLTEVQVQNPRQLLLPGMYAEVRLSNARTNPPMLVPSDSILTNANGIQLAILRDLKANDARDGHRYPPDARAIHIQNVQVGRDYGPEIEITRGLEGWEYVVVNPSDAIEEGAVVEPVTAPRPRTGRPAPNASGKGTGEHQ
jgi:multidrug efflux pump subunit AcrA (membrane-fusion protein)